MLLTGLQGQAQSRIALGILGLADQTPGNLTLVGLLGGEESGMGPAKAHGNTETLRTTHRDVSTELGHRSHQGLGQRIDGDRDQRPSFMGAFDHSGGIPELAIGTRQLKQQAKHRVVEDHRIRLDPFENDLQGFCPGLQHRPGLGKHVVIHQESVGAGTTADPVTEAHGFCSCRRLIQQRSVSDRQTGEFADQRLEIEQSLQTALGDLGLIRGVSRVPGGVFKHMALDQRRRGRAVIAQADEGASGVIGCSDGAQMVQCRGFIASVGQNISWRMGIKDVFRHHIRQESRHIDVSQRSEHRLLISFARANVTLQKW